MTFQCALSDSGSQASFITEAKAKALMRPIEKVKHQSLLSELQRRRNPGLDCNETQQCC